MILPPGPSQEQRLVGVGAAATKPKTARVAMANMVNLMVVF